MDSLAGRLFQVGGGFCTASTLGVAEGCHINAGLLLVTHPMYFHLEMGINV